MATTKVTLMNRAMAAVGNVQKVKIQLSDEDTSNARTIRRFYDITLDAFLEEHEWNFATKYSTMSTDSSTPAANWAYVYVVPPDCVATRRIVGNVPEELVPYQEGESEDGVAVLWTDKESACLEYTGRVENYNAWSPAALKAFALALAIDIAPDVTGGVERMQLLDAQFAIWIDKAKVASFNSQERIEDPIDPFTEARHGLSSVSAFNLKKRNT